MTSGEYIIPNEYDIPNVNNDVPAHYAEYTPSPHALDLNQIEQNDYRLPYDREIEEGMGPGPENDYEHYPEPDIADHCDPPGEDLNE